MAMANESPRPRRAMDPDDDCGYQVELFIYDLSGGLAPVLSPALLGKQLDGVWHTGVVAYGREYFFSSAGIESCKPGGTVLGEPNKIEALGESQVPYQLFLEYIFGLGESAYKPGAYDLLKHNCNNFSDELAQFLCGRGIPKNILQLPDEVLNTPFGITLNEAFKKLELKHANSRSINFGPLNSSLGPALQVVRTSFDDPEFDELNDAIEQVRNRSVFLEERRNSINDKLSKKERKERRRERRERKEKRRKERGESVSGEKRHKKKKNKPPLPPSESQILDAEQQPSQDILEEDSLKSRQEITQDSCGSDCNNKEVSDTVADSVNRLSLSEKEDTSDFVPVDDFWGNQQDDDDCTQKSEAPSIENTNPVTTAPEVPEKSQEVEESQQEIEEDCPEEPEEDCPEEPVLNPPPEYSDQPSTDEMADNAEAAAEQPQGAAAAPQVPVEDLEPEVEREPPILFKEHTDGRRDFDELVGLIMNMLSNEEQKHMEELRAYVVEDDGAWALGENFGELFSRIFTDENIPEQARFHLVRILAVAALKDDVILLLHQDRRDHTIMNFCNKVERLSPQLQEAIALFFCNMFEHLSPSEWLLYISEWSSEGGPEISNIRVTTKVAVNALLHSNSKVQEYGTAIMYNLGTKEVKTVVFDDVAPELAMAILQYLSTNPNEELLWRSLTALCRFCYASSEVPSLIKMIGPDPNTFKGKSERIDTVVEEINVKTSRVRLF